VGVAALGGGELWPNAKGLALGAGTHFAKKHISVPPQLEFRVAKLAVRYEVHCFAIAETEH
jgi:hypothetical protein